MVGGAVLIATGAACIVLTGGAATPIVADVAVAVGSGTAVFGAADAIEGTQDIYYGSTGDIDSTAVNGIKDDLFQGNEDAYYLTENAFAFAASAMIPIGQASTAGNLTFKSTATIVAKEGISMGAGAGAQKITTDVTGNDTAGMVAGMVASGVTAKGLNGIEAEANKLAKAQKGLNGVSKGAESAAEDAGKIVEGGSTSLINIGEIRPKLKTEPNTAFFWSGRTDGIGGADNAANIAKSRGGVTLESTIESQNIVMPEWDFNNPSTMEAWDAASGAYAEQVSGEIRAVIGAELRTGNIWENVELPRLMKNPNVTKITTIDPKTGVEKIIFER